MVREARHPNTTVQALQGFVASMQTHRESLVRSGRQDDVSWGDRGVCVCVCVWGVTMARSPSPEGAFTHPELGSAGGDGYRQPQLCFFLLGVVVGASLASLIMQSPAPNG